MLLFELIFLETFDAFREIRRTFMEPALSSLLPKHLVSWKRDGQEESTQLTPSIWLLSRRIGDFWQSGPSIHCPLGTQREPQRLCLKILIAWSMPYPWETKFHNPYTQGNGTFSQNFGTQNPSCVHVLPPFQTCCSQGDFTKADTKTINFHWAPISALSRVKQFGLRGVEVTIIRPLSTPEIF